MAQVPYRPLPTAQPDERPVNEIRPQITPDEFGANVGSALRGLGSSGEGVGNELFTRATAMQELANETAARKAAADYVEKQGLMQADFDSLKGKDAHDALMGHIQASEKLRQDSRDTLNNPMAQRVFDNYTFNFKDRIVFSSARHAGDEFKTYNANEALASADTIRHTWVDPSSPQERQEKIDTYNHALETVAPIQGWGPDKLADEKFKNGSAVIASQANALARQGKVQQAQDLLEDAKDKGQLEDTDYDKAYGVITDRGVAIGAKLLADQLHKDGVSFADAQPRIQKAAEDFGKDNQDQVVKFKQTAENAFRTQKLIDDRITSSELAQNRTTLWTAIAKGDINSVQQIQADPDLNKAYQALTPKERNDMPTTLLNAARKRDAETETQSYNTLQGMALERPQDFLNANPYDPQWKLSRQDLNHFLTLRNQIIKQPIDDPVVRRGISAMRQLYPAQLKELGVYYSPTKGAENTDYDQYVGSLKAALDEFTEEKKRPPTQQEFKDQIAPALLRPHAEPAWWGLTTRSVPEFLRTVPQEVVDKAKGDLAKGAQQQGVAEPTDEEVRRYILQQQWQQFYKGSKQGGASGGTGIPE